MADADDEALNAYYMQAADAEADADTDAVAPVAPLLPPPVLPGLPPDPLQQMQHQIALMQQQHQQQQQQLQTQIQEMLRRQQPPPSGAAPQPPLPMPTGQAPPPAGLEAWEPGLLALVMSLPSYMTLATLGRIIAAATGIGPGELTKTMMMTRSSMLNIDGTARKVRVATAVGSERMDVVEGMAYDLSMIAGPMSMMANGVSMVAAAAALHELYGAIAPENDVKQDVAALFADQARAARLAEKDEKEFSPARISTNLSILSDKYGRRAPTRGQLLCPQQLRLLHDELVINKMVPCSRLLEIERLLLWGGDNGVTAGRTKKDEDPEASDPKDAVELRARFAGYVHSIGVVTAAEADGEAIYGAALDMLTALERSVWLTSLPQVRSALRAAIGKARRMRNETGVPPSIQAAYDAAADVIMSRNDDAADPDKATPTSQQQAPATSAGALTSENIKKMIADAAAASAKGANRDREKPGSKKKGVLVDGKTVSYEVQKGGNPKCPIHCNKAHEKEAWCHFNHSKK